MEYKNSQYVYAIASPHACNCPDCPQRSLSPTSSNDLGDSGLYTPTETPGYSPAIPYDIALDSAPAHLPLDTQVDQLNGWEAPQNGASYGTPTQEEEFSWLDYAVPKLPGMLPAPPELPETDFWLANKNFSGTERSSSTPNAMFPAPVNHPTYNQASHSSPGVQAENYHNTTVSKSQPNFTNVQLPYPQISAPTSNRTFTPPMNTPLYSDASVGYPALDEFTLYNLAPPQPNFAMQSMQPSHLTIKQPPLNVKQYIPPQSTVQPLQSSHGLGGGTKRKRTADADEVQERTDDEVNLLHEKKITNKKKLSPVETGMKIPCSGYVERPKIVRTTKGPSPSKSSKGKAAASSASATGKSRSRGPKKANAATFQETDDAPGENEPGTSQDGGRRTKRARTSNSDAPSASSSRPWETGSSDGGRLVDAADAPEFVNLMDMFRHDPRSAVKTDHFLYMVLAGEKKMEAADSRK